MILIAVSLLFALDINIGVVGEMVGRFVGDIEGRDVGREELGIAVVGRDVGLMDGVAVG